MGTASLSRDAAQRAGRGREGKKEGGRVGGGRRAAGSPGGEPGAAMDSRVSELFGGCCRPAGAALRGRGGGAPGTGTGGSGGGCGGSGGGGGGSKAKKKSGRSRGGKANNPPYLPPEVSPPPPRGSAGVGDTRGDGVRGGCGRPGAPRAAPLPCRARSLPGGVTRGWQGPSVPRIVPCSPARVVVPLGPRRCQRRFLFSATPVAASPPSAAFKQTQPFIWGFSYPPPASER